MDRFQEPLGAVEACQQGCTAGPRRARGELLRPRDGAGPLGQVIGAEQLTVDRPGKQVGLLARGA